MNVRSQVPQAGAQHGSVPTPTLNQLLYPRRRALRRSAAHLWGARRLQLVVLIGLAALFNAGVFVLFHRALAHFLGFPEFGAVLTYKLLSMVFVVFFSVLAFSNVVTALSSFYLADDLDGIVAAPVTAQVFFYARYVETVVESSWMIVMFAVPALCAYGVAHAAGPAFYLIAAATLPPFVIIPAALGVGLTTVLVNISPARRTRELLVLLSIVTFAFLYLALRVLQPERLLHPEASAGFAEFLVGMSTPTSLLLPTTWATEAVRAALRGEMGGALRYLLVLSTTAAALTVLCELLTTRLHLSGWSKSQEGRPARFAQRHAWERLVAMGTAPFPRLTRLLLVKELRTFFRDTSQWSQLVLLLALVVVYVYNFRVIPLGDDALVTFYFRNVVAFFNLALAAFVIASVSVRFVFPSISLESRYLWISRCSPMDPARIWWGKFWIAVLPLSVLGQILSVVTNYYLEVAPLMVGLSSLTLAVMTPVIVSLGLAVGATHAQLGADNAAKVAASAGGVVYMILCMAFIGSVVALEAWPIYTVFSHRLYDVPLEVATKAGIVASLSAALGIAIAVFVISARLGIRQLEAIEP